jgi:hypothetical protein
LRSRRSIYRRRRWRLLSSSDLSVVGWGGSPVPVLGLYSCRRRWACLARTLPAGISAPARFMAAANKLQIQFRRVDLRCRRRWIWEVVCLCGVGVVAAATPRWLLCFSSATTVGFTPTPSWSWELVQEWLRRRWSSCWRPRRREGGVVFWCRVGGSRRQIRRRSFDFVGRRNRSWGRGARGWIPVDAPQRQRLVVRGEVLLRLSKPIPAMVLPRLMVCWIPVSSSGARFGSGGGRQRAMVSCALWPLRDLVVIFFSLGASLPLYRDTCPLSFSLVGSACVCLVRLCF